MDREKWNTPGSGGESVPGTENDAVQPSENSGKGNEKHEIPSGEAGVDYSRAAGVREEIRRPQGASAWNTGGTTFSGGSEYGRTNQENGYTGSGLSEEETEFFRSFGVNDSGRETDSGPEEPKEKKHRKKTRKPLSTSAKRGIACVLIVVLCFAAGVGGGALGANLFGPQGGTTSSSKISIDSSESSMDAASVIAEKVMPSVVGISTVSMEYRQSLFGVQQGTVEGSGTGFIVDENGYILTNSHVVDNGETSDITVDLYDGSTYTGTVLWSDSSLDLAIVKIDAKNLQAVDLGDSDDVKIGDYAIAIGNPLGQDFERSVTQGIISGLDRTITTTDGESTNTMQGLIQTDASINSGNSGGPLINSSGEVIGINTAKASSAEGLGFAIPINTALPVIEEVKENGTYESVYLGISGMSVEDAMAQYETDFKTETGVAVVQIYTDSPAAVAGMKEGDVITAIDGEAVENMSNLKKKLVHYRPGDKITVTVERNKQDMTLELTLQAQSQASTMQYKSSGTSGSYGSGSSGDYYGGQQDGSGSYGGSTYGDLFGGFFGN